MFFVFVVLFCRDDWLGLDGMVKQKNPDENVNHIPLSSAAPAVAVSLHVAAECTANVTSDVEQTTLEASKRCLFYLCFNTKHFF